MTDPFGPKADAGSSPHSEPEPRALIEEARREAQRILAEGTTRAAALRAEAAGARYEARHDDRPRLPIDPSSDPSASLAHVEDHELHAIEAQDRVLAVLSSRFGPSEAGAASPDSTGPPDPTMGDAMGSAGETGRATDEVSAQPKSLLDTIDMESSRHRSAFFAVLVLAVVLFSYGFLAA